MKDKTRKTRNDFKWKHFLPEIILLCIRWYLKYKLSFRDLVEMMSERGIRIVHTTIMRWIHEYSPKINKRIRKYLKTSSDSYRLDETYIKIKGKWCYLYRAIDSKGNTLDFLLSEHRDKKAAKIFLKRVLKNNHASFPRVINTDKAPTYPYAITEMKKAGLIGEETKHRTVQYCNNIIEQDHMFIKKRINPMLGFFSFRTANYIIKGIEAMHMIRKIQIKDFFKNYLNDKIFINNLFGIAA